MTERHDISRRKQRFLTHTLSLLAVFVLFLSAQPLEAATATISFDNPNNYTQEDLAYAVTLTPSAATGSITLTLGSGTWNSNAKIKPGCWVQGNSGAATLTGTPSAQTTIAATVNKNFANTNAIAGGSWNLYCASVFGGDARLSYHQACGSDTVSYGGQTYTEIPIGTQCWMGQNLNVGTRVNGTATMTNNATVEKYCYSDTESNCTAEGGLYQWDEAMGYVETSGAQGICPSGWHIPTDAEWYTLESYLATDTCTSTRTSYECDPAGTILKPGGRSGFNGLLAGDRISDGSFIGQGTYSYFWSSSVSGTNAWRRSFNSSDGTVNRYANNQDFGFSVRCLKD